MIQTGSKVLIVNNATDFPLTAFNKKANGSDEMVAVSPTVAKLKILGYGELVATDLISSIKALSVPERKQTATWTATLNSAPVGSEVIVTFRFKSSNLEAEFERPWSRYGDQRTYTLTVDAGETPTTLAAKLKSLIDLDLQDGRELVTVTQSVATLTFTSKYAGVDFKIATTGSPVTATFTVTAIGFEGRGLYKQLNKLRLQTPARVYPYSMDTKELPIEGGAYTTFLLLLKLPVLI